MLDAGCGTGRVAIELARRGIEVVGVDVDPSMLATARERAPDLDWVGPTSPTLDLGRTFDVVVMAGNVPLFTAAGHRRRRSWPAAPATSRPAASLVAGFQLGRGYDARRVRRARGRRRARSWPSAAPPGTATPFRRRRRRLRRLASTAGPATVTG